MRVVERIESGLKGGEARHHRVAEGKNDNAGKNLLGTRLRATNVRILRASIIIIITSRLANSRAFPHRIRRRYPPLAAGRCLGSDQAAVV